MKIQQLRVDCSPSLQPDLEKHTLNAAEQLSDDMVLGRNRSREIMVLRIDTDSTEKTSFSFRSDALGHQIMYRLSRTLDSTAKEHEV
jgi:hypothetical protein